MIVVLHHGIFGFNAQQVGPVKFEYFPGIAKALKKAGHHVITTGVNPVGSVVQRANQLAEDIERQMPESDEQIYILAHSMGGLDARQMLSSGMAPSLKKRAVALVTIATPHRGSPVADFIVEMGKPAAIALLNQAFDSLLGPLTLVSQPAVGVMFPKWVQWLGLDRDAISNLTTDFCVAFDQNTPNVKDIRYFSIAANCTGHVPLLFRPTYDIIFQAPEPSGGENDGMVSLQSATPVSTDANRWTTLDTWPVDHINAVNMKLPGLTVGSDMRESYLDLVRQLA